MNSKKSCSIKLLNKTYDIKCPEGEENNLQLAAKKLNNHLLENKKKFKQMDDFQNFLLAALHTSHELVICQQSQEEQRLQVSMLINSLESKINQVVTGQPFFETVAETD